MTIKSPITLTSLTVETFMLKLIERKREAGMSKPAEGSRQRESGSDTEQQAVLDLFRTSDRMQHRFARLFREYGLTPSQYNILRILRAEGKAMPCLEIAQRTITVVPGITGLIDRLENANPPLVSRLRSEEDRRIVNV